MAVWVDRCTRTRALVWIPSCREGGARVVCSDGVVSIKFRLLSRGLNGESSSTLLLPGSRNRFAFSRGIPHTSTTISKGKRASGSISHSGLVHMVRSSLSVYN